MWTVNGIIDDTLKELNFSEKELKELPDEEARAVTRKAKSIFVESPTRPWWHLLKKPYESLPIPDDVENELDFVRQHLPLEEERCYFIPENEGEPFRVFEGTFESIFKLLENCSFFEYYLVGKEFDWFAAETDHNALMLSTVRS